MEAPTVEDVVVRQYRYLLRTAPLDALEAAHVEALEDLDGAGCAHVLRAVQTGLVAGMRLSPGQAHELAHLISLGERRAPGTFLAALAPGVRRALADRVVLAEASFGLFGGYAGWDGAEPPVGDEGWCDGGFGERWHDALVTQVVYRNFVGGPSSPDSALGGRG